MSISELEDLGFNIYIDDDYINVYKDNKLMHKVKTKGELKKIYYNE